MSGIGYKKNRDEIEHYGFNLNYLIPGMFMDNLVANEQAKCFSSVWNQDFSSVFFFFPVFTTSLPFTIIFQPSIFHI